MRWFDVSELNDCFQSESNLGTGRLMAASPPSQPNRTDRGFFTPYLAALPQPASFSFFPRPPPVFFSDFFFSPIDASSSESSP